MEFNTDTLLIAFGLTLIAGLSTGIGSAMAFFAKRTNTSFLSIALGFSAGVMIYISFVEIFFNAKDILVENLGTQKGAWITISAFFGGMLFIALIDKLIPEQDNPHEINRIENMTEEQREQHSKKQKLMRMGILTGIVIAIHNFPEGMATMTSALVDINLGIAIAIAVAIHNIPEGIAISVPIYYATGSRKKAFIFSFLSGLSEPAGAIVGFVFLSAFMNPVLVGIVFAAVAGIMVFISLDELLPAAREYGKPHLAIYGMVTGMVVMAISLLLI